MELFLAKLVGGVATGSIYALLTVGLNLLILVSGVLQFSYPHIVVLTMYVLWAVLSATANNLAIAIPVTIIAGIVLNLLTEPLFRRLVAKGGGVSTFIVSIGIAMVLSDLMGRIILNGQPVIFPEAIWQRGVLVSFGLVNISRGQLVTILGTVGALLGIYYVIYRTKLGRAFRAMAQSQFNARLLGIPILRTSMYSFIVAGLLGGAGALFLAMALGSARGALGDALIMKVLIALILAGMGNLTGGVICGLGLGIVECLMIGIVPGTWSVAFTFGIAMVVVLWRPQGLFGMRV